MEPPLQLWTMHFNYVAQPGDQGVALMPNIGPDKHAVNWGYRPILDKTAEEESHLNQWI